MNEQINYESNNKEILYDEIWTVLRIFYIVKEIIFESENEEAISFYKEKVEEMIKALRGFYE